MRILHVTPYWADAWAYGGIPRVAGALVRALADAGHHVTVCTTDVRSRDTRRPLSASTDDGAIDLRVFRNRSNRAAYDWQLFTPAGMHRFLRDHAHEFDVAHLHACRNFPVAMAAHHLRRHAVPYVMHPNGTAPVIERRRFAKRVFDVVAGHRILRAAAAVVAVSEAERRQLVSLGVAADRIAVVPNPLDLTEFDPPIERGRFRRAAGLGSDRLVAFLGKITPRKRLDVLVRAFAVLPPDTRLVIAGNDMGGLERALSLARSLGVRDRVLVTGLLAGRVRLELLADADVVSYPSENEVFGLVAAEAILAGTPVVVSRDSGCGEVVRASGGGLITSVGDARELADAMQRILAEPDAWRDAVRTAAVRLRERYDARQITNGLLEVYRSIPRVEPPPAATGVSVVVPVKNGMPGLARTLASIEAQVTGGPIEIIVVDDRSEDDSSRWLAARAREGRIRLVTGAGRGASEAMNLGFGVARYPIVCQVDQDVELLPGWASRLVAALERDPGLGAVEGEYVVNGSSRLLARVMALDLEQRYAALAGAQTNHVCTGNAAYRAAAVRAAGGFDESLGYGADVDMSHRLIASGWRLEHCRQARSVHAWRSGLFGYLRQQYGFGYGRLDAVERDRRRVNGDDVSPLVMMAHPVVILIGLAAMAAAGILAAIDRYATWPLAVGVTAIGLLAAERAVAGARAWIRSADPAALLFPIAHFARDIAWVAAIVVWGARRMAGRRARPTDSMRARPVGTRSSDAATGFVPHGARPIAVVPCHNEAATVSAVIADVRDRRPGLDLLVVDDGSTDASADIAARAGVQLIQLPERMGVGTAMRASLRYARRMGYDCVVRLDADGQHQAADIDRLLAPILEGRADVVSGSRFLSTPSHGPAAVRTIQRGLAACLSMLTNGIVTDPTCGFCAFGPRALRLLADEHPTGYAEPETRLLLSRHALTVVEVPIEARPRLGGRTSLTVIRLAIAAARVLLAMVIVPLRRGGGGGHA